MITALHAIGFYSVCILGIACVLALVVAGLRVTAIYLIEWGPGLSNTELEKERDEARDAVEVAEAETLATYERGHSWARLLIKQRKRAQLERDRALDERDALVRVIDAARLSAVELAEGGGLAINSRLNRAAVRALVAVLPKCVYEDCDSAATCTDYHTTQCLTCTSHAGGKWDYLVYGRELDDLQARMNKWDS